MNPQADEKSDIYGVPTGEGQQTPQMNGHNKDISPLNDVPKPSGPLSPAVERLASQGVATPEPATSLQDNSVPSPTQTPPPFGVASSAAPASPPEPSQKNKKPLLAGLVVGLALLVLGGGGAAYALWYSNPDKAFFDAISNIVKAQTMITKGKVVYEDKQSKGRVSVDFSSESDNPKLANSLSADLKVEYPDATFNLKGAGMIAESGDLYFKLDNATELFEQALKSQYGAMVTQDQSTVALIEKLRAFFKKIDGNWIAVEKEDISEFSKAYEEQQACAKKELDSFYKDSAKQKEITDLYAKYKFIDVKDSGTSEAINGQDSIVYDLKFDAKQADEFGKGLVKTDLFKKLDKCDGEMTDNTNADSLYASDQNPEKTQKELNKLKTKVWVSRWSHEFTKVHIAGDDATTGFDFAATLDQTTKPNLAAPQSSLKVKDLQKDIEGIFNEYSQLTQSQYQASSTSMDSSSEAIPTVNRLFNSLSL